MNTPRVSREQAELLKKVGYDVPTPHYYCEHIVYGVLEETGDECDYNNGYSFHWSRPALDEATRWLREVKGWHLSIVINPTYIRKYMFVVVDMNSLHKSRYKYTPDENETTHDLALSAGIDLILKKLTNGTE
jgi:hypothetical protein